MRYGRPNNSAPATAATVGEGLNHQWKATTPTVIYRNFIAPPRAFTQLSHELIRHPRLSSDAVRLLTWQLSLPQGARESLSRTAERARIGSTAFARAKRQLKDEGFVHERRVQAPGGLWVTQQLVSSVPLSAGEATKILAGMPVRTSTERVSPQVAPSPGIPAAGEPTAPSTDGHPKKHPEEDTSNPPPELEPESEPESADDAPEEARAAVAAFPLLSPALRHIPPGMRDELAHLTARWLAAGHTSADVHEHVLRGLPGANTPVHRPGGLLRHLLRDVPPLVPAQAVRTGPRLSPRLAGTRECEGDHVQPMLFRPLADDTHCAACDRHTPSPLRTLTPG
ncbi:hypothetical protein ACFC0D_09180 [Streptomyces sp. NPDC056222]|uniref:hypothetical protein n=1 Tax=Streptomyces sp. NPDC056222 TaxID=3345749 RepID=UPI0035DDDD59